MKKLISLILLLFIIASCKNDISDSTNKFTIKIGVSKDPTALLPIKRRGRTELQINPYLFLQAMDFNPKSLKNIPILLENIPNEISIDTGKYKNLYRYNLNFKQDATWDNGTTITANDYLFTIKLMLNPLLELHPAIRHMYSQVKGIEIDPKNPKKFSVFTTKGYMLSKEMITNMEIYPEYFYDSLKIMRKVDLETLINKTSAKIAFDSIQEASNFAKKFNGAYFMRNHISGSGPYKLANWEANQYVILKKKENWWGEKHPEISYLNNNPEEIIFKIIPDKTTSLTELKNGNIDLLSGVLGSDFLKMKNDTTYSNKFDFHNPLTLNYYSIILNNRNPILKDKNVRLAIAHLIDIDFLIKTYGSGAEKRLTSPIHPSKSYYNNNLKPIDFDIKKASELVKLSKWTDSNGDGIVDKTINGKKHDLSLSISITGRSLGKGIALMLQENAKKIGIEINIVNKSSKKFRNDKKRGKFDIIPVPSAKDLVDYDPYPKWHSDNINPGSSNISGFQNKTCDSLIEKILIIKDFNAKTKLYKEFQEIIYKEQPVIFLYVPTNNIIVNSKFDLQVSSKRPGYFVNTIKIKK
jgi:peptide/nickel transport system substrate-binding protein